VTTPLITCRELVEFLNDYLSNELPPERQAEFEFHLAACPSCVAYMKTYRESVALGRRVLCSMPDAPVEDVPPDLLQAILAARERQG
jgi:anti-sigma factor RsiW